MQERPIWAKVREIEQERAAKKREQEERDQLAEAEREKVRKLRAEADDWQAAQTIRRYLAALEPTITESGRQWLAWANAVADQLDPFPTRSAALAAPATPTEPAGQDQPTTQP